MGRSISVTNLVNTTKSFKNKRRSVKIIRDFFCEVSKILKEGKEVRFTGNKNGKVSCVVEHTNIGGLILKKNKSTIFKGNVKPKLYGFEPSTAGRTKKSGFKVKLSYHWKVISDFNKAFSDKKKRSLLPERQ